MRTLSNDRRLRLLTLGALYLAQGLPWGFIAVGYLVFLTDLGLDNAAVSQALAMAYLPWSFKIFAGPLLDGIGQTRWGRRRPFILAAEVVMGLSLLALYFVDPVEQLSLISGLLFLHNSAAALQDVAVDALAVDILPEDERGRANSIMWAAKSLGVALGGGGGTVIAGQFGWGTLFITLALAVWAIMLFPLLIHEREPGEASAVSAQRLDFGLLWDSFSFATPWIGALFALLGPAGYALVGAVTTRMLRADLGLSEAMIGTISGVIDPIAGVLGALAGGLLADRIGTRRTLALMMVCIAACLATWGLAADLRPHIPFIMGWTAAFAGTVAAFSAASFGLFMSISNPRIGATHFAAYMATTNLTYSWATGAGGEIADAYGYATLYVGAAGVQIAAIAILPFLDPSVAEVRYRKGIAASPAQVDPSA